MSEANPIYFLIYETTNLVNGKYYRGKHKTSNYYDEYLGSGKQLHFAKEKYGFQSFSKHILFCAFSEEDAFYVERHHFVTQKEVDDPNCYNLKIGGDGGFDHIDTCGENNPNPIGQPRPEIQGPNHHFFNKERPDMKGENNPMNINNIDFSGNKNPNCGRTIKMEGENNPSKRPEVKEKLSGKNNSNSKPLIINGIEFISVTEASKYFNKCDETIKNWIRKEKYNAYFI